MGSKIGAKELLRQRLPSVQLIPGYSGPDQNPERLRAEALRIGRYQRSISHNIKKKKKGYWIR
jgi:acetyl/propionyl-CoA carboxylase alpha subunit